jgi:hypothetical protein
MNRILKYAWYQLVVVLVATVFAAAAFTVIAIYWRGKEVSAIIPLGLFAFVHLYRVFFPLKPGQVPFDERDLSIMRQATHVSFVVLMYVYAVCCLVPVLVIGNGHIHVMYLGGLVLLTSVLFRITWAIAAIVQYGKGGREV